MKFLTDLDVRLLREANGERAEWVLLAPLIWESDIVGTVTVPTGTVTDLASVPRFLLIWLVFGGVANKAAVLHDYYCQIEYPSKKIADNEFYEAMLLTGIKPWKAWCMWKAVSWFGRRW